MNIVLWHSSVRCSMLASRRSILGPNLNFDFGCAQKWRACEIAGVSRGCRIESWLDLAAPAPSELPCGMERLGTAEAISLRRWGLGCLGPPSRGRRGGRLGPAAVDRSGSAGVGGPLVL